MHELKDYSKHYIKNLTSAGEIPTISRKGEIYRYHEQQEIEWQNSRARKTNQQLQAEIQQEYKTLNRVIKKK